MTVFLRERVATALRSARLGSAVALVVLGCAWVSVFHGLWGQDLSEVVPVNVPEEERDPDGSPPERPLMEADHRFVIWLVSRNAYTFLHRPGRLFEAEPCHPAEKALAFGEPAITLGLLGVPAYRLTEDPLLTFNAVVLLVAAIAPLAMFLLVRDWTGVPAAGIVAGLLYGFHQTKLVDLVHVYALDSAWTVLAIFFARRLFERLRWRDAIGLALCCGLQIGGSLYQLMSAALIALPVTAWCVAHHGIRRATLARGLLVAVVVALVAAVVFAPFLELRSAGVLSARGYQYFLPWSALLPEGKAWPGFAPSWLLLGLAVAGLVLGRPSSRGDPRWALLVAAGLTLALATQPRLYEGLAALVPGLELVRNPGALYTGTHLVLCILAGFGVGGLVRASPARLAAAVAAALVLCAWVDALRPRSLGLRPRVEVATIPMRPRPEAIEFFRTLEHLGNAGPILELPLHPGNVRGTTSAILLSAYHHRRTSSCYNSFDPPEVLAVRELAGRLPKREAIRELRRLGFTTIVVHHRPGRAYAEFHRGVLEDFTARTKGRFLEKLHGTDSLTAYAITASARERRAGLAPARSAKLPPSRE